MSRSLNKVTLIGNAGSEPEVRATPNGGRVAQFSLATSRVWSDATGRRERTEWHRCVVWNTTGSTLADIVERYVKRGDKLYVEGRIEYRQWQDKDGQTRYSTEITVRELILLGGPRDATARDAKDESTGETREPSRDVLPPSAARPDTAAGSLPNGATNGALGGGADTACPKCGGATWDNRASKRNPKAPDFKCKDKGCDGVVWPPREGEQRGGALVAASAVPADDFDDFPALPGDTGDDDDLPF